MKDKIALLANQLLAGDMDSIEACRKINNLRFDPSDPEHDGRRRMLPITSLGEVADQSTLYVPIDFSH